MNQELWRSISESERIPAYNSDFYFYPHAGHREYMLYSAEIRLRLTSAANVCSHRGMTMFKDLGNETNTNHGFDDSSRRETLEEVSPNAYLLLQTHMFMIVSLQILELAEDLGLQEIWTSLEIRTGVDPGYFGGLAGLRLGSSGVVRDLFSNSVFTNGETLPGFHVLIFSYR